MGEDPSMRGGDGWSEWAGVNSADALERWGAAIAAADLRRGEAVCLFGPLGAGKSTLARGLIRALTHAEEEAPSPTFTLMQVYDTAGVPLAHLDLYRLEGPEEAFEIGLEEALDVGAAVVEWSERLGGALPPDRLEVELAVDPPAEVAGTTGGRWLRWRSFGALRERNLSLGV